MRQDMPGSEPDSGHSVLEHRISSARQREQAARAELRDSRREREFWERLLSHIDQGHSACALLLLRSSGVLGHNTVWIRGDVAEWLQTLAADMDLRSRDEMVRFPTAFPDAIAQAGLVLDRPSRYPGYTLKDGFVRAEVDEPRAVVTIAPRDGEPITVGADVDVVVQTLSREIARIFERPFDCAAFLRAVFAEYNLVRQSQPYADGDAVPLRLIARNIEKRHRWYTADMFNVDLARLLRSGSVTFEQRRLICHHTRDVDHGMLPHGLEQGGYIGHLTFSREEHA